jgi:ribonucleoside-diphosphate reductase alpha chain
MYLQVSNPQIWKSISSADGSVQHLDISEELKQVFLTAKEINQFVIVGLAADRQEYIDQAQSVNLFFPSNASAKYIHEVHYEAWQKGLKSLYYYRTESILKGDKADREYKRESTECSACEA